MSTIEAVRRGRVAWIITVGPFGVVESIRVNGRTWRKVDKGKVGCAIESLVIYVSHGVEAGD